MDWLVIDQGRHFKNKVSTALTKEIGVIHHFTTAYSPLANGTVGRANREVFRATKALLSEWRLGSRDWPAVVDCVTSVLNQSALKRLGQRGAEKGVYRTPLEVLTSFRLSRPLMRALPIEKYPEAHSEDELQLQQLMRIEETQEALAQGSG